MGCLEILKNKGLKLTPQRRLIVDIIHEASAHLTAEEIIAYVKNRMPGVNKSTIYRTLELLEQCGCVYKSGSGDHFIYHHAEHGKHHHLFCSKCGKSFDCSENLFLPVEKSLAKKYGLKVNFRHMVISGLCEECRNKAD